MLDFLKVRSREMSVHSRLLCGRVGVGGEFGGCWARTLLEAGVLLEG